MHGAGGGGEQHLVETFIPQLTVEAFAEAVLLSFAGRDVVLGDIALF